MRLNTCIRVIFWFAFAAFLSASIPHVAYFFRSFEPSGDGQDTFYWCIAYAIAISIDITIFLLSLTVAQMYHQRKPKKLLASVWIFIIGLVLLSWYINYKYAQQFASPTMLAHTSILSFGIVGNIDPLIASMFQALALAYTWIADKIASDEQEKSAEELRQEADELEAKLLQQKRIADLKNQGQTSWLKGKIEVFREAQKDLFIKEKEQVQGIPQEPEVEHPGEQQEEVLDVPENEDDGRDTGTLAAVDANLIDLLSRYPKIAPLLSTSRRTATIREVAETTGYTEKWIRNRVANRLIKVSSRNKNLVLIDSLIAWLNSLPGDSQKGEDKPSLALVKDA